MNTEEQKKKRKKTLVTIAAVVCGVLLVGCLSCLAIGSLVPNEPIVVIHTTVISVTVTSAVPPVVTTAANATNEAEIYAVQTLTAMPTATPTATFTPRPTKTPRSPTLTSTVAPTSPPAPTSTTPPVVQPTLPPQPTAVPTAVPTEPPPPVAVCDCSYNRYNCANFSTHRQAQACFNYCWSVGAGDIHRLDADNDGSACESLP